jgi:hypothetical protein
MRLLFFLLRSTLNCLGGADGDGAVTDSDTEDVATLADNEGVDGDDVAGRGRERTTIVWPSARDLLAC